MIIQSRGDVIKLKGALVANQWPALQSAVSLILDSHPVGAVIDASGLTEINEAGARTFLDASTYIQAHNGRVVIAGLPDDMLQEVRQIPGLRSQLVISPSVEEARASLESGGTTAPDHYKGPVILVPVIGAWRRALEFAVAHAVAKRAEIHLLYVIQVPRNLPLGVPVPEAEHEAQRTLDEAEQLLKRRGVRLRKLTTRAREAVDGAAKFAAEANPELVVIAFTKSQVTREGGRYSIMNAFCHESSGAVAAYCVPD